MCAECLLSGRADVSRHAPHSVIRNRFLMCPKTCSAASLCLFDQVIKQARLARLQGRLLRLEEVRLRLPALLALTRMAVIRMLGDAAACA